MVIPYILTCFAFHSFTSHTRRCYQKMAWYWLFRFRLYLQKFFAR